MKIIYRKGDLLESDLKVILHGCNAQGIMGSGIAKQIRERYPQNYEFYREYHKDKGLVLGEVLIDVCEEEGRFILNGITQEFYGTNPSRRYCDYAAIRSVMQCVEREVTWLMTRLEGLETPLQVGMPKIGAGLANGDWDIISAIIEEEAISWQPIVYTLE